MNDFVKLQPGEAVLLDVEDEVATDSAFALSLSDCPAFGLTNPAMSPTLHQVDGWYIKYKLRRNAAVGSRQVSE